MQYSVLSKTHQIMNEKTQVIKHYKIVILVKTIACKCKKKL